MKHDHVNPRVLQTHHCIAIDIVFDELPTASIARSAPCRSFPMLDAVRNLDDSIGSDVISNQDIHPDTTVVGVFNSWSTDPKESVTISLTNAEGHNLTKKFTVQ